MKPASTRRYRTIWISDIHLGTRGCKADLLLDFLEPTTATSSTWSATSSTAGASSGAGTGPKHTTA